MAITYTNFCCRSGGSNLNAGTRTGNTTEPGTSHDLEYAAGTFVRATRVFTVASGDPVADGVAVGDYVSVFTVGSTTAGYIGQVSARTTTTITISSTINTATTANVSETANNATLRVGGAWAGPSGASSFPFSLGGTAGLRNANTVARCNLKNDQTYSMTATLAVTNQGANQTWYHVTGYQTAFGDGGRALIQGPASGASFNLLTAASYTYLGYLIVDRNGSTGTANLVVATATYTLFWDNCVFSNGRGYGFNGSGTVVNCEIFGNVTGGVQVSNNVTFKNCMIHDNTGFGLVVSVGHCSLINCVIESNTGRGLYPGGGSNTGMLVAANCDIYNNGSHGVEVWVNGSAHQCLIMNCNIFKNAGYGIKATEGSGSSPGTIAINNCYGAGTQANTSGQTNGNIVESGAITYATDSLPWTDAPNGDFRLTSSATAIDSEGFGTFLQTAASYAGSVSYPSIGACQPAANVAGGSSGGGRLVGRSALVGESF